MMTETTNTALSPGVNTLVRPRPAGEAAERLETDVSAPKMKALLKVAEQTLRRGARFEQTSRLGPVRLRLDTDHYRLYQFWHENWFAVHEPCAEPPGGRVSVAAGIEDEPAGAYYCGRTGEALFLGFNSYALCRSWALTLAAELAARQGRLGLSAATLEAEGAGVLVMAQSPALLAAFALQAARSGQMRIQNLTWTWLEPASGGAQSLRAERSFLVPGAALAHERGLQELMRAGRVHENVLSRRDACVNRSCLEQVDAGQAQCAFEEGQDYCYVSRPASAVLLHEGMLPACAGPEEVLPVRRMLLVSTEAQVREPQLEKMSAAELISRAQQSTGDIRAPWCMPLLQPVRKVYRKVLTQCASAAETTVLKVPERGLREAGDLFDRWCSSLCKAHAG